MRSTENNRGRNPEVETVRALTPALLRDFLTAREAENVHARVLREDRMVAHELYEFLPEGKLLTAEGVLAYRSSLYERGLAASTVTLYSKSVNHLLKYLGREDLRIRPGKASELAGKRFGQLTALYPTEKRSRRNIIWKCRCDCGSEVEATATCLTLGRVASCGCLKAQILSDANRYIGNTSLRQALKDDPVRSARACSGYTGVTPRGGRWRASIVYRGHFHYLGTYSSLEDAVRARARAKEEVQEDARRLERLYRGSQRCTSVVREVPKVVSCRRSEPGCIA